MYTPIALQINCSVMGVLLSMKVKITDARNSVVNYARKT